MKKFLRFLLAMAAVLALSACGSGDKSDDVECVCECEHAEDGTCCEGEACPESCNCDCCDEDDESDSHHPDHDGDTGGGGCGGGGCPRPFTRCE